MNYSRILLHLDGFYEQDPSAIVAAEQVTQTHSFHPLTTTYYDGEVTVVREKYECIKGQKAAYILLERQTQVLSP